MATLTKSQVFAKRNRDRKAQALERACELIPQDRDGSCIVTGEVVSLTKGMAEWCTGMVSSDDGSVSIPFVGDALGGVEEGCMVRLRGAWERHERFGLQFRVERVETQLPIHGEAVVRYLSGQLKYCGKVRAMGIVKYFGAERVIQLLVDEPQRVQEALKGKAGERMVDEVRAWAERTREETRARQLAAQFMSMGMTYTMALKIQRHFKGRQAEAVLMHHPYRLVEVRGIGFKTADAIARAGGISGRDPSRIAAGVVHALRTRMEMGDSGVPRGILVRQAVKELTIDGEAPLGAAEVSEAIDRAIETGGLISETELLFLPETVARETFVASRMVFHRLGSRALSAHDRLLVAPVMQACGVSCAQEKAVWMALESGVSVLTGRPGSGKTTTVRAFVRCCEALEWRVALAAPTGKAASRAGEVTGIPASTVHRLISAKPYERREKPIEAEVVIIDETSMADLALTAWLLDNIDPRVTRILFVGDSDQLPSVGHGRVLGDLIDSGVIPTVSLTEIWRQAQQSHIIVNANRLLDGKGLMLDNRPESDFWVADVTDVQTGPDGFPLLNDPERSGRECSKAQERLIKALRYLVINKGANPLRDIQVLTPIKKGGLGVEVINELMQREINPGGMEGPYIGGRSRVRVGDRVLQTKNDYTLGLFNGDQGEVVGVSPTGGAVTVRFEDQVHELSGEQLSQIRLAWAMTVHRSQGSEFPYTILMYHTSHHMMLELPILYTAITRAKKMFLLIGTQRAIDLTVHRARGASERYTGLAGRIRELWNKAEQSALGSQ